MIITVLMKLTQFEKTGSMGKIFIPLGNLIIKFNFQNWKPITFIVFLTFDSAVCLPFTKRRKSKFEPE